MICIAVLITSLLVTCNSIDSKIYFENELPELKLDKDLNDDPVSHRVTTVALKLDRAFSAQNPFENVLFSPLSVTSVISLLLLGAKGYTALELSEFLGVNLKARMNLDYRLKILHEQFGHLLSSLAYKAADSYELDSATGLFPQNTYPVKHDYLDRVENIYRSEIVPVDYQFRNFDALAIINKWVANKTHDRITHLLAEPPAPETTIIIANALYFNGNWKYPFLKAATKRANFYAGKKPGSLHEEVVDVDLMVNSADIPYLDDETRDCQMIGLPYVGEEVYMYIILPNKNLEMFMRNFTENDLHSMIKSASNNTTVIFAIPKMKLDNNVDLTPTLYNLGLKTTFNPVQADFRNMANGVFVDIILHRVELEVDEIGTKASAATLGSTLKSGATPVVRVDRPFLFFIHHKSSDTVLFWGKIIKPTPNYPAKEIKAKSRRFR